MKLSFLLLSLTFLVLSTLADDDFYQTKDVFIDNIVDRHLQNEVNNEKNYRQDLTDKLFDALVKRYPNYLFYVNVYKPVMGFDSHVMTGFNHYSRLHKQNDNRFNLYINHIQKNKSKTNDLYTEQQLEYVKSVCHIRDCGDAM